MVKRRSHIVCPKSPSKACKLQYMPGKYDYERWKHPHPKISIPQPSPFGITKAVYQEYWNYKGDDKSLKKKSYCKCWKNERQVFLLTPSLDIKIQSSK